MTRAPEISSMLERYQNCVSYIDHGQLTADLDDATKATKIEFQTHYMRPDCFRFDWAIASEPAINTVIAQGSRIFSSGVLLGGQREFTSLEELVTAYLGSTMGQIGLITSLLVPQNIPGLIQQVRHFKGIGENMVVGQACKHFLGEFEQGGSVELFIEKHNFTLRRFIQKQEVPSMEAETAAIMRLVQKAMEKSSESLTPEQALSIVHAAEKEATLDIRRSLLRVDAVFDLVDFATTVDRLLFQN